MPSSLIWSMLVLLIAMAASATHYFQTDDPSGAMVKTVRDQRRACGEMILRKLFG